MEISAAARLLMEITALGFDLSQRITTALNARRETIELENIGRRFETVNEQIQAARGPQDPEPAN